VKIETQANVTPIGLKRDRSNIYTSFPSTALKMHHSMDPGCIAVRSGMLYYCTELSILGER